MVIIALYNLKRKNFALNKFFTQKSLDFFLESAKLKRMIFDKSIHCRCIECGSVHRKKKPKQATEHSIYLTERDRLLISFYMENNTLQQTANRFNLSREGVRVILLRNNIIPRKTTYKPQTFTPQPTTRDRFNRLVDKKNIDQCWLWKGTPANQNYGRFWAFGKYFYAHQLAYYLHYRKHPKYMVLHKCNNEQCVNPYHLYDGTQKENCLDRDLRKKGINRHIGFEQLI